MKKIFSLLAALIVLSTSGVWAQNASTITTTRKVQRIDSDATAAAELESGYYLVKFQCKPLNSQTNKSAYVFYKGNDVDGAKSSVLCANDVSSVDTDTISSSGSLAYVWYVSKLTDNSGNNILTIQCAGNGGFFPKQDGHGGMMNKSKNFSNVGTLCYSDVATTTDNSMSGVLLYQSNCSLDGVPYYVHANNANAPYELNYWEGGSAGSTACLFSFYKVTLADDVETQATPVFYSKYKKVINGVDTGEEVTDCTTLVRQGDTPVNPFLFSSELYDVTYSPTTITSSTDVVTVNFTSKSNSYCRPKTYYKLKVRGNDMSVYAFGTQAQDVEISQNNFGLNYSPERYWRFEQEGLGVKMQCLNGKYIKVSTPSADGATFMAELVDNNADASTFYMEGKPSNSGTDKGFSLKYAANTYLGDHSSDNLGVWRHDTNASTDKGSCFVIESNLNDDLAAAKNLLSTRLNNMTQPSAVDANMLRVATTEQIESAKTVLDAATDIQGVVAAYNKAFTATPDANAYYRIKCIANIKNRYPSSEDIVVATNGSLATYYNAASDADKGKIKRTIDRKKENDLLIPQLWQFVPQGDGTYKIQNANNSCCWANATSSIDMPISTVNGGNYRIVALPTSSQLGENAASMTELNDGVTTFQLLLGGNVINAYGGDTQTILAAYNNHDADNGNYWQIEKIENFDVAINAAAKYATVGYPFPVQVTNNDVKVYYATEAKNGILKLTEATNNIIPANEGAILYSESGATTANMKILASSTESTFADNKLTATTAKREGFTSLSTYGLSNRDGIVCFRKNSDTNVPANKAYLDANKYTSNSGSAQQLLFSFDNVVEGIDNVVKAQNANKVYYDLQGRRVLYPAHGIFVTENGEKVFIK